MIAEDKATLVINAIINKENVAELPDYLGKVMPVFIKNGGQPLARYKISKSLVGTDSPEMVAIIEFPNADVIEEMANGKDFMALTDLRSRVFNKLNMVVCESL
ncbi:MAG: hypothetical protein ACI9CU_002619 [Polaribacter sp.]|jgi:uncharacterized protein (DUF1330 family)